MSVSHVLLTCERFSHAMCVLQLLAACCEDAKCVGVSYNEVGSKGDSIADSGDCIASSKPLHDFLLDGEWIGPVIHVVAVGQRRQLLEEQR